MREDSVSQNGPVVATEADPAASRSAGRRRVALWAAGASVACWAVALAASLVWLHGRSPCPPNYVRLVDLATLVPVLAAAGVALGVVAVLVTRTVGLFRVVSVLMCVSTALALLVTVSSVGQVVADWGASYDAGCWAF